MNKLVRILVALTFAAFLSLPVQAQLYSSTSGGYSTGYGTVYGSMAYATATQNLYNSLQYSSQYYRAREDRIARYGKAAVEREEREAKAKRDGVNGAAPAAAAAPAVPKNYGAFRPDATVDTGKLFADSLAETPDQKTLIKTVFTATKTAFEKQAEAKGWKNNIASGLTFFTVAAVTVRYDVEEPSDQSVEMLYKAFNMAIDDVPEFAKITNREKVQFNNVMIGFAGLLLAGYTEGKEGQNPDTVKAYGQLADELIKMVFKVEPDRLKIKDGAIVIE